MSFPTNPSSSSSLFPVDQTNPSGRQSPSKTKDHNEEDEVAGNLGQDDPLTDSEEELPLTLRFPVKVNDLAAGTIVNHEFHGFLHRRKHGIYKPTIICYIAAGYEAFELSSLAESIPTTRQMEQEFNTEFSLLSKFLWNPLRIQLAQEQEHRFAPNQRVYQLLETRLHHIELGQVYSRPKLPAGWDYNKINTIADPHNAQTSISVFADRKAPVGIMIEQIEIYHCTYLKIHQSSVGIELLQLEGVQIAQQNAFSQAAALANVSPHHTGFNNPTNLTNSLRFTELFGTQGDNHPGLRSQPQYRTPATNPDPSDDSSDDDDFSSHRRSTRNPRLPRINRRDNLPPRRPLNGPPDGGDPQDNSGAGLDDPIP
ncbi:hypothetical protein NEOLEDRAFT_1145971 [Neolentinus lepideus HHB14362 ss-1]|uniref:Uncharacterized protein n=1 Tax=Neolentinus lepideus HHB14362 ss-1 TaxID=1314782 RepID=A0A165UM14_9AGAM|nr:hypothetical protein NEOLEDRAFT_1145971 [Neolentinus lepideus HHB14362 ss-1]